MRKFLIGAAGLAGLAAIGLFGIAPTLAEKSMNRIEGSGQWPVSAGAKALHKRLVIIDTHGDTLLWQRSIHAPSDRGHIDLARLEAGNVALQVFSSVTKTPKGQNYESNSDKTDNISLLAFAQLQPFNTWGWIGPALLNRSLWHAEKLRQAEAASKGRLRIVRTADDLGQLIADRAAGSQVTGALLSSEGMQNLEGNPANLDVLHRAGFRMMGLAHFFDNDIAGSMHGEKKSGLTALGRRLVPVMEDRGIIIDLAHASHATFAEVMQVARRPVVISHGGVKGTCNTNRNLTDAELRLLARNGGFIGIGYWGAAVCAATPQATARAILHAVKIAGIDHVGLGSDFDGSTTTGFDTAHIDAVTEALLAAGMAEADIARVMGGNALRLLTAGLAPLATAQPAA
jgi:membrane dipeptidase